jgi:choline dehydrogenase-like flavoprotein
VAWSLAETRMKMLCLERGDWIKSSEFPSNGRDWEARRYTDFDISPNRRARETDYPINDDNSLMKIANFNGVGGGTILFTAHYPRLHPSDFRVRTLDGVADDWPIDYWTLEPYFADNDRMTGVAGLAGDPAYPPHEPTMPPVPLGKTGTRYARAMNQLGWHWWPSEIAVATTEYDGRAKCINLGHCTPGCAQGAKASVDITYWPHALSRPGGIAHALPGTGDRHQRARHGVRRHLLRRERGGAVPAGGGGDPGGKRHRHAAAVAEFGLGPAFPLAWPIPPAWWAKT